MDRLMKFFEYSHLQPGLNQEISEYMATTAININMRLNDSPEKTAGLRKLLEAKDCFVRAALEQEGRV